mmetsp:Transcript_57632/g.105310  ORF Transcript_57632/g.105310 Transcript_57632/m.105310 type:complete len:233 (-) Transcript_57632:9-707(-)
MSAFFSGFSAAPPRPAKTPPRPANWRHLLCFCLNSTSACECVPAFGPAHWRPFSSPKPQVWPYICGSSFSAIFSSFSKNSTSACECVPVIGPAKLRPFSSPNAQELSISCLLATAPPCFCKSFAWACAGWKKAQTRSPTDGACIFAFLLCIWACEYVPADSNELDAKRSVASFFKCGACLFSVICWKFVVCTPTAWQALTKQAAICTIERILKIWIEFFTAKRTQILDCRQA